MYKDERDIARKAEEMLETALRRKTSGFKAHYYRTADEEAKALKKAKAKAKVKKYGLVKDGTAKHYMRSLGIRMDRHGFVQHYGVDTLREDIKGRTRHKPRTTTYGFKTHAMKLKARPFIDSAIAESGVVPFVLREVTKHRAEELMLHVKRYMEKPI